MPIRRFDIWRPVVSGCGILTPLVGVGLLVWGLSMMAGCGPRIPSIDPPAIGVPVPPSITTIFVPDTSETFWILRLLAYAAFAIGFFCILGAIATRVIGLGIGFSSLLVAGLSCFAAGVGMSALQYFLQAYLRVVVFGTLILGVIALIPLYRAFYKWAKFRLGQKLAAEGDYRAGVSHMADASPKINKVRKQLLERLGPGVDINGAIKQAIGK